MCVKFFTTLHSALESKIGYLIEINKFHWNIPVPLEDFNGNRVTAFYMAEAASACYTKQFIVINAVKPKALTNNIKRSKKGCFFSEIFFPLKYLL